MKKIVVTCCKKHYYATFCNSTEIVSILLICVFQREMKHYNMTNRWSRPRQDVKRGTTHPSVPTYYIFCVCQQIIHTTLSSLLWGTKCNLNITVTNKIWGGWTTWLDNIFVRISCNDTCTNLFGLFSSRLLLIY